MALRDQPYLPLYIQDFLTDEKLAECSAAATGVYIRLMCLMHKSESYGKILLKQKNQQSDQQIKNFASQLVKQMPYDFHTVTKSLEELIDEKVISVDGDMLIQKRMVKDNIISEKRAISGKKGGQKTVENNNNFAKANNKANEAANTESEYEDVNEGKNKKGGAGGKTKPSKKEIEIPDYETFKIYCLENSPEIDLDWLKKKYDSYVLDGWKDGNGKQIVNWKSKMLAVLPYGKEKKKENGIVKLTGREKLIQQVKEQMHGTN